MNERQERLEREHAEHMRRLDEISRRNEWLTAVYAIGGFAAGAALMISVIYLVKLLDL